MKKLFPSFSIQAIVTHTTGARFMTIFGTVWALLTLIGLNTNARIVLCFCVACTTLLLLRATHALFKTIQQLPPHPQQSWEQERRGFFYRYDFALVIQISAIILIDVTLSLRNLYPFLVPATGLHMLHLAAIFRIRLYYATDLLLVLFTSFALVALSSRSIPIEPYQWSTITGLSTAILF